VRGEGERLRIGGRRRGGGDGGRIGWWEGRWVGERMNNVEDIWIGIRERGINR
jgi:hypothetical protein